jgi:hypothetical protein
MLINTVSVTTYLENGSEKTDIAYILKHSYSY